MISFEQFKSLINLYIPENFTFKCFDCGDCCRHESGYVFLLDSEIKTISRFFKLKQDDFISNFTFKFSKQVYSIKERENYDCVFWDKQNRNGKGGCSIYKVRPVQCVNFPFWLSTFADKESFEQQAARCKGIMAKEGKFFNKKEIYKLIYLDLKKRELQYKSFLDDEILRILYD